MPRFDVLAAGLVVAVALLLQVSGVSRAAQAQTQPPNDVARLLAGLPLEANSPLATVMKEPAWQQHRAAMDSAWASLERRQLAKIRTWQAAELKDPQPTLYYMFSGPDFLYADAFFPHATTYVLSGLETTGPVPQISESRRRSLSGPLAQIRSSLNPILSYSFFRTKEMRETLGPNSFSGTLPLIYIFLARSGKTIETVTLHDIDDDGLLVSEGQGNPKGAAQAAKIVFKAADSKERSLYYVRTDLSDNGLAASGFIQFCDKLGRGDALVKSASYLLHSGSFSFIRSFILTRTARLVQDDSGIPVSYFMDDEWRLRPYGNYLGPISLFPSNYQSKLAELFRKAKPPRIDFGIGYRYRPSETNVLVADSLKGTASR